MKKIYTNTEEKYISDFLDMKLEENDFLFITLLNDKREFVIKDNKCYNYYINYYSSYSSEEIDEIKYKHSPIKSVTRYRFHQFDINKSISWNKENKKYRKRKLYERELDKLSNIIDINIGQYYFINSNILIRFNNNTIDFIPEDFYEYWGEGYSDYTKIIFFEREILKKEPELYILEVLEISPEEALNIVLERTKFIEEY